MQMKHAFLTTHDQPTFLRQADFERESGIEKPPVILNDDAYDLSQNQVMLRQCFFHVALLGQRDPSFSTTLRSPQGTKLGDPYVLDMKFLGSAGTPGKNASLNQGSIARSVESENVAALQCDASPNSCRTVSTEPRAMELGVSVEIAPNDSFNMLSLHPIFFKYIGSILCHFDIVILFLFGMPLTIFGA